MYTAGGYINKDRAYDEIKRSNCVRVEIYGWGVERGGAGVNDESRRIEDCTETILFREGGFEPD